MNKFTIYPLIVVWLLLSTSLFSCYYATQGYYLLDYTLSAKKIEKYIQKDNLDDNTKKFLQNIQSIRKYAIDLGLSESKNYTTYKAIDREYLVAVVQAAEQLSVAAYKWDYPFMGKLPYKGYYKLDDARTEAKRLQDKGYDVWIRTVSAFSTLGILKDPIYSFMQQYSESQLVELIIHEQMHATVWLKKQDQFNEQLATFVGRQGMLKYMRDKYGEESQEYNDIFLQAEESKAFTSILLDTKSQLEELYSNTHLNDEQKLLGKKNILAIQQQYVMDNYDSLFKSERYKKIDITQYNNAFFALISTYEESSDEFQLAYEKCGNDIELFLTEIKKILLDKEAQKSPYDFLASIPKNPEKLN